jgi:hypothetical protein
MDADSGRHSSKFFALEGQLAWSADDRYWREADIRKLPMSGKGR